MIPRKLVDNYVAALNKISKATQDGISKAVSGIDVSDVANARNAIIEVMDTFLEPATQMSAALAASYYDACRQVELGEKIGAQAEPERVPEATHETVRAFMQTIVDGGTKNQLIALLCERADYEIKVVANKAIVYIGERDSVG